MFCVFQHFVRSVLIRNSAISSSDRKNAIFFSSLLKQPPFQANKLNQSTSFPIIESMVYCQHLPNRVGASWLQRISLGIGANQRRPNILNEKKYIFCVFLHFFRSVLFRKSARSPSSSFFHYCPSNLVSKQILLVFSVTPFKINQNQNQNHSIDKVQNLGNERR